MGLALRVLLQAPRHLGAGQPGCWPLLPSEPALPSLGNHVGSSLACGLWLLPLESRPQVSDARGPYSLWDFGNRLPGGGLAGGLFWLRVRIYGSWTQPSLALRPVKRAQACVPVWLASQDCHGHPVRRPRTEPRTVFAQQIWLRE